MSHRIAHLFLLFCLVIAVNASIAAPPSRQSLEDLMEISGLSAELKGIEQTMVTTAVAEASRNSPQDEKSERLIELLLADNLRETFEYSLLMDEVTYFLKKHVSEEDVQTVLDWYRSELGQRIKQAEAEAGTPNGMAEIQNGKAELLQQQDLAAIASEVDSALGLSEAMVELQINTQKAMILAGLAVLAPEKDISEFERADWSDIKTADREALRQPIAQAVQASFVYTMKGFSQEERAQYREFLLKPASIRVNKSVLTGIGKAVEIGAHNFMTAVANDVKNPSPELAAVLNQQSSNSAETEPTATEATPIGAGGPQPDSDW